MLKIKQTYPNKKKKKEKGSALFLALVLTVGLVILGTSYVYSVHSNSQISMISYAECEAMHIAEAGAEVGVLEVNQGGRIFIGQGWTLASPNVWTRQETIDISGGATIGEYLVTVTGYLASTPKYYEVESIGYFPSQDNPIATKIVKLLVEEEKLFKDAVMGYGGINIGSGALVDSYDSRLGFYGVSGNVGTDADFVTNATAANSVEIGNNSVVTGDVTIGSGGVAGDVIKLTGDGRYDGTVKWLNKAKPKLTIPDQTGVFLPNKGALNVAKDDTYTINDNEVEYNSITLGKNAKLIINADTDIYIIGDIDLGVDSQLVINPGISATLWVNGDTNFNNGATIQNTSQDPMRLKIYCTDNVASFDLGQHQADPDTGKLGFFGNIYAPNADVWIGPDTDFYGSVVGKTVGCTSGLQYHYDIASRDDPAVLALGYFVTRWQGYINP